MKTILVDDNALEMELFCIECEDIKEIEIVGSFNNPLQALEFAKENDVEFALLDIDMPGMNGLELANKLRGIRADIIIMFVTGHTEHAVEALRMKVDYIIFKPYDKEDIMDAVSRAKLMHRRQKKRVCATLFGSFDVSIDGEAVKFRSSKAKELMALLISHEGENVSIYEILDKLWEDEHISIDNAVYRKAIKNLSDTLKEYNCENILVRERGQCRIEKNEIDSDYYSFLEGDEEAIIKYQGEFLNEYSWGEYYIGRLNELKEKSGK